MVYNKKKITGGGDFSLSLSNQLDRAGMNPTSIIYKNLYS